MTNLIMRPLRGREEIDLFNRLPYVLNEEFAGDLGDGRRRLEWMWVALRGDRLVARLGWWARSREATQPLVMDVFDVADGEPLETGAELYRTASQGMPLVDFLTFVPGDWRGDPEAKRITETRLNGLGLTGARVFVERLRLEWLAGTPIAPPTGRLVFRPVDDADDLIGLMTRVLDGTLDAHSRRDLEQNDNNTAQVARDQYHGEFLANPQPRDWWRIATLRDGTKVGFVIPARNAYNAIISYIGVVPEHRGNGYIDDILAEGTRIAAASGPPRIRAATDVANVPMAKAFARNGYRVDGGQINLTWG